MGLKICKEMGGFQGLKNQWISENCRKTCCVVKSNLVPALFFAQMICDTDQYSLLLPLRMRWFVSWLPDILYLLVCWLMKCKTTDQLEEA